MVRKGWSRSRVEGQRGEVSKTPAAEMSGDGEGKMPSEVGSVIRETVAPREKFRPKADTANVRSLGKTNPRKRARRQRIKKQEQASMYGGGQGNLQ